MGTINKYYNKHRILYGISGDRKGKIVPLIKNFKNGRVLDVGCSTGYLGEIAKKSGNYVVGWDMVSSDVKKASKILDEATVIDLESGGWPRYREKFDLIIFSEVIEHLFMPEKVLERLLSYLKPEGMILITTPNIVHLYWRIKFLKGEFEYQDESVSVINPAHLHLFTYSSLVRMTKRVGLSVSVENHVIYPRTLSFFWKLWPSLFAYQFVFLFRKSKK